MYCQWEWEVGCPNTRGMRSADWGSHGRVGRTCTSVWAASRWTLWQPLMIHGGCSKYEGNETKQIRQNPGSTDFYKTKQSRQNSKDKKIEPKQHGTVTGAGLAKAKDETTHARPPPRLLGRVPIPPESPPPPCGRDSTSLRAWEKKKKKKKNM